MLTTTDSRPSSNVRPAMISRFFTTEGQDPFDGITWVNRSAVLKSAEGEEVFRQDNIEAPDFWSDRAINIVARHYLRGTLGTPERETSIRAMISRVAREIAVAGKNQGLLTEHESDILYDELCYVLVHQKAAFNSPVWYNVGVVDNPQASACFILSVEDSLLDGEDSIMETVKKEARIFKYGSGSGFNISRLREENADLAGGGKASGVLSFMKGFDSFAGIIKSGGKCLAPDQRVYTSQGPIAVKELADKGDDFVVLSYDPPSGRYKAKTARAWKSGKKKVLRVHTDKGYFDLSADHPVKLSNGPMVHAGKLEKGMSLFACSVNELESGHIRVNLRDGKKGKELFHRLVAKDVMGEDLDGLVVHHKDHNPKNNDPNNLEVMHQSEHARAHATEEVDKGVHVFQTRDLGKNGASNGMHRSAEFWSDKKKVRAYKKKQSKILRESGRAKEMQDEAARQKMLNTAFKVLNAGFRIDSFDEYVEGRKVVIGRIPSKRKLKQTIKDRFGTWNKFVSEVSAHNHRVIRVENLGTMDVYDVEVDCPTDDDKSENSGHNFVIWPSAEHTGSGIVVSNTRRAAKMVILDDDHPDLRPFITLKAREEKKMRALVAAGYDGSLGGEAEQTVTGQNANNSVRVSDAFMRKALGEDPDPKWHLKSRGNGVDVIDSAPEIFDEINKASWECADPGIQFDDTINAMHTCPENGRIRGSNPCSEYMFLDDTSCNLASINLCALSDSPFGMPNANIMNHVCDVMFISQEILVSLASYPTESIARRTRETRPLGLGYGNLGALLMANGIGYDSDYGRRIAGALASLMTSRAYYASARFAEVVGPFSAFEKNREHVTRVLRAHARANDDLRSAPIWPNYPHLRNGHSYENDDYLRGILAVADEQWKKAILASEQGAGIRNAQATVIAPTGTISFLMDFDTTSCEPAPGLVTWKTMVDGSVEKMVFRPIDRALRAVGFEGSELESTREYILEHSKLPDSVVFKGQQGNPFLTAFGEEGHTLSPEAHVLMVAAIQPFISGAISKTVNLPNSATVDDVKNIHVLAWKTGVKAISLYRDGSKNIQVISTTEKKGETRENEENVVEKRWGERDKLPHDLKSHRHKFRIAGQISGYLHIGENENGEPKEVFISVAKTGGTMRGILDALGASLSYNLQLGMPLSSIVEKYMWTEFEPRGFTSNPDVPSCTSVLDYIAKYLAVRYLGASFARPNMQTGEEVIQPATVIKSKGTVGSSGVCPKDGGLMVKNGVCDVCTVCGETTGCS